VARKGRPRRPGDLAKHDYLRYAGRDDEVALGGKAGSVTVAVPARYRVNSAVAMLEAARAGAGIALEPCWMVDAALRDGSLVRLLPQWTGPAQTVHLLHAPRRRQPMRVQAMLDVLAAAVPRW
jgi:DNA-binding transcriptional LysR family regulator